MALRGFITNLGLYSEGELVGKWIEFPITDDELEDVKSKIGIDDLHEEWFFTDYECDLDCFDPSSLSEYENIEELNDLGEKLQEIDDHNLDSEVSAGLEYGLTLYNSIEKALDGEILFLGPVDGNIDESIAKNYIEEVGGVENLSEETIDTYIDYESLGRDIRLEYYKDDDDMPETAGEFWCGDENASDEDIGVEYVNQSGFEGVNNKQYYFDYESFGRDIRIEGNFVVTTEGIFEII